VFVKLSKKIRNKFSKAVSFLESPNVSLSDSKKKGSLQANSRICEFHKIFFENNVLIKFSTTLGIIPILEMFRVRRNSSKPSVFVRFSIKGLSHIFQKDLI